MDHCLRGIAVAPGAAVASLAWLDRSSDSAPAAFSPPTSPSSQREWLAAALSECQQAWSELTSTLRTRGDHDGATIFEANVALLDDPGLHGLVESYLVSGHKVTHAWAHAVNEQATALESLDDPLLRSRARDFRDLALEVQAILEGRSAVPLTASIPADCILVARRLTLPDAMRLDTSTLRGLCLVEGGGSDHVAIVVRGWGIPVVVGVPGLDASCTGKNAVLDGDAGVLVVDPNPRMLEQYQGRIERMQRFDLWARTWRRDPAVSRDGQPLKVYANVSAPTDVDATLGSGADGVGLLRTEFLCVDRSTLPTELEQTAYYRSLSQRLGKRRILVRTFDIGADKTLPYLALPPEANPALGCRGIRLALTRPHDLLFPQLRAILQGFAGNTARILLPMVSMLDEVVQVRAAGQAILEELDRVSVPRASAVEFGIMVETPAAALMIDRWADEIDFLSIGTNDLTQYVMAVDRGHTELSGLADAAHPPVLRLIDRVAKIARQHDIPLGVCGEFASTPVGVALLMGLGIDSLSVHPSAVPRTKALIRSLEREQVTRLARAAIDTHSVGEVYELLRQELDSDLWRDLLRSRPAPAMATTVDTREHSPYDQ